MAKKRKRFKIKLSDEAKAQLAEIGKSDPERKAALLRAFEAIAQNPIEMGTRIHTRMSKELRTDLSLCLGLRLKAIRAWGDSEKEPAGFDFDLDGATLATFETSNSQMEKFKQPHPEMKLKAVHKTRRGFRVTFEAAGSHELYELDSRAIAVHIPPEALEPSL
jgi:hypothetical protein